MPAIHQKSLNWLLTFSTSPSETTIQIAIDGNFCIVSILSYHSLQGGQLTCCACALRLPSTFTHPVDRLQTRTPWIPAPTNSLHPVYC
jgi:hypothetical protein